MAAEGFKVGTGYFTVVPDDENFQELVMAMTDKAFTAAGISGGRDLVEGVNAALEGLGVGAGAPIVDSLAAAGTEGGEEFTARFDAATATVGDGVTERLYQTVEESLADLGVTASGAFGRTFATGLGASLSGIAISSSTIARLTGSLVDGATEAGGAAGDAAIAAVGDSAGAGAGAAAGKISASIEAALNDSMGLVGASAADRFSESFLDGTAVLAAGVQARLDGLTVPGAASAGAAGTAIGQALGDGAQAATTVALDGLTATLDQFLAMSQAQIDEWLMDLDQAAADQGATQSGAFAAALERINQDLTSMTPLTQAQMAAYEELWQGANAEVETYSASLDIVSMKQQTMAEMMAAKQASPWPYQTLPTGQMDQDAEEITKVGTAAEGAGSELGGMGAMMGGPVMMALYGGMMVLPMLSGILHDLGGESDAVTLSQTGLASAITTSSGTAGDSVASYVASQAQLSGMAASANKAGLDLATYTEAVLGNAAAQNQVTTAVDAQNKALSVKGSGPGDPRGGGSAPYAGPAADQIASNDQLTASMAAQNAQIMSTIDNQALLAQALMTAEGSAQIFQASMDATYTTMQSSAQQSAISAVAMLNLGDAHTSTSQAIESTVQAYDEAQSRAAGYTTVLDALTVANDGSAASDQKNAEYIGILNEVLGNLSTQADLAAAHTAQASVAALDLGTSNTALNVSLIDSESAYTLAQQGATAYGTALTDANGSVVGLIGSQAAVTTSLDNFTTGLKTNGKSLDDSTAKGAANVTNALATAAAVDKATTAVYQNALTTETASQAYQTANSYLTQEKDDFITAADKAGLNKTAVQQLANELYQLPSNIPIAIDVTSNIDQVLANFNAKLGNQDFLYGGRGTPAAVAPKALGGPVQAGQPYIVGENRAELFVPDQNGTIIPSVPGARGGGPAPAGGSGAQVTFQYFGTTQPTAEQHADMMRSLASVGAF